MGGAVGAGVAPPTTLQAEISAAKASAGTSAARFLVRVGSAEEFDMACLTKKQRWRFPITRLHSRSI